MRIDGVRRDQRDRASRNGYVQPVRPATLDEHCYWATIEKIGRGATGVEGEQEKWACEMLNYRRSTTADVICDAAKTWYEDTDQCGDDVLVTIRLEDRAGAVWIGEVHLLWNLRAVPREVKFAAAAFKAGPALEATASDHSQSSEATKKGGV